MSYYLSKKTWSVGFRDYFHNNPRNWLKLGQHAFQGHPYFTKNQQHVLLNLWGTCHRVVMHFPSQLKTKCPAAKSIENAWVAIATTKTRGTSMPVKVVGTMHYDPMTSTPYISSIVMLFFSNLWVALKSILSKFQPIPWVIIEVIAKTHWSSFFAQVVSLSEVDHSSGPRTRASGKTVLDTWCPWDGQCHDVCI